MIAHHEAVTSSAAIFAVLYAVGGIGGLLAFLKYKRKEIAERLRRPFGRKETP